MCCNAVFYPRTYLDSFARLKDTVQIGGLFYLWASSTQGYTSNFWLQTKRITQLQYRQHWTAYSQVSHHSTYRRLSQ